MANMAHCRFTNTLEDLKDCYNNMDDNFLTDAEAKARLKLIQLCVNIAADYEDEFDAENILEGGN